MKQFLGRKKELKSLRLLLQKKSSSLAVIRGRRRIGKSRLVQEFGKDLPMVYFSGLPPVECKKKEQRDEFARIMSQQYGLPPFKAKDWGELFAYLAPHVSKGRHVVVFDEISWMAYRDSTFLGKLKNAWDLHFSKNPELILILCGSVSSWIERNILSQTGFVGRISLSMHLDELPICDCLDFWDHKERIAPYELFKVLSVTGGVPKYLEEILTGHCAESNIRRLCFEASGLLFREFEQIFSDLFSKKNKTYRQIIEKLIESPLKVSELQAALKLQKSGKLSLYLEDLVAAGFLSADPIWNFKERTQKKKPSFRYRVSDNYVRFYLKYIAPYSEQIDAGNFAFESLGDLPNCSGILGLQFENLVLSNRAAIFELLGLKKGEVLKAGPYFQTKTKHRRGCQVDFVVQTKYRCLYLCEIKFTQGPVGIHVIESMQHKTKALALPRGFSYRTVLIHVNGVTDEVRESHFFDHTIDFSDLMKS